MHLIVTLGHAADLTVTPAWLKAAMLCAGSPVLEAAAVGAAAALQSVSSSEEDAAGGEEIAAPSRQPRRRNARGARGAGAPSTAQLLVHLSYIHVPLSWRSGQVTHAVLSDGC